MDFPSARFIVHRHSTGRSHFDLRLELNGVFRSWSLLRGLPMKQGERRLAIERESFTVDSIGSANFEEAAFGVGRVSGWDDGTVNYEYVSPKLLVVRFEGRKLSGKYEFRRMRWYPGNRWLLAKLKEPADS